MYAFSPRTSSHRGTPINNGRLKSEVLLPTRSKPRIGCMGGMVVRTGGNVCGKKDTLQGDRALVFKVWLLSEIDNGARNPTSTWVNMQ